VYVPIFRFVLKLTRRDFKFELTVLNSLVVWMVVIGVFDVKKGSISIQSYEIFNSRSSSVRISDFIALFSWSIKFFLFLFSFTWFDEWIVKLKLSVLYYLNCIERITKNNEMKSVLSEVREMFTLGCNLLSCAFMTYILY